MSDHFHPSLSRKLPELCQLVGNYGGKLPDGDWFAEEKIDGWRAICVTGADGRKKLLSRNGVPLEGVGHILHRLEAMERAAGERMFFDGEFQVGGTLEATKQWCERDWKGGGEAGTFYLFDAVPERLWLTGGSDTPWYKRRKLADNLWNDTGGLSGEYRWEWREGTRGKEPAGPHVLPLSWEYVGEASDIAGIVRRVWSNGGEGVVIKRANSPYVRDRSNDWLKIKRPGVL